MQNRGWFSGQQGLYIMIILHHEHQMTSAPDVQVTKKLSEIRETLSTSQAGLKLKHLIIINDTREIDPVDISINLCELEL